MHMHMHMHMLFLVEQAKAASYHRETGWHGCFSIVVMTLEGARLQVYDLPGVTSVRAMCAYHDKLIVSVVRPPPMHAGSSGGVSSGGVSSGGGPSGSQAGGSLMVLEGL